jgi:hypothetical protein
MHVVNIKKTIIGKETIFSADFILTKYRLRKRDAVEFYLKKTLSFLRSNDRQYFDEPNLRKSIWFKVPTEYCNGVDPSDAFFVTAMPMALYYDEELDFHGKVSAKLYKNMERVGKLFSYKAEKVTIKTQGLIKRKKTKNGKFAGQFYTLGIDSLYTFLLNRNNEKKIKYLIYVDGYDVYINQHKFLVDIHKAITSVSKKTGCIPIFVQSNLRSICDVLVPWHNYHIAPLAAVTFLLSNYIDVIYYNGDLKNLFNLAVKNRYFASETAKMTNFGAFISRIKKIRIIKNLSYFPFLLKYLRVCNESFKKRTTIYNCSKCEKCTRTILSLKICGVSNINHIFSGLHQEYIKGYHLEPELIGLWKEIYQNIKLKFKDKQLSNEIEKMLIRNKTIL